MNSGLTFNVLTLLLDDRFPVTGLVLLDDGSAIAIAVPVDVPMAFAHRYAGADRPGANADLVRHRKHARRCGNRYFYMMSSFQLAPAAMTVSRSRSDANLRKQKGATYLYVQWSRARTIPETMRQQWP
jgi:hypothetical protein